MQIFPHAVDRLNLGLFEQEADKGLNDFLFLPLWAEAWAWNGVGQGQRQQAGEQGQRLGVWRTVAGQSLFKFGQPGRTGVGRLKRQSSFQEIDQRSQRAVPVIRGAAHGNPGRRASFKLLGHRLDQA